MGSSPRMRGAHCHTSCSPHLKRIIPADAGSTAVVRCLPVGIIPADAGSTLGRPEVSMASWDHPRGCGEHALSGLGGWFAGGSSPRMRGARFSLLSDRFVLGIIPADAGSTGQ